jgi:phage gpG-like protein
MTDTTVRIEGLPELQKAMNDPKLWSEPTETYLKKATLTVEGRAKEAAPVDTGRYRASIKSDVKGLQGIVGTDVEYARFIEFGSRPHWIPAGVLQSWAQRHGFDSEFSVRKAIASRGTKARLVLTNALKESMGDIQRLLGEMGKDILIRWQNSG